MIAPEVVVAEVKSLLEKNCGVLNEGGELLTCNTSCLIYNVCDLKLLRIRYEEYITGMEE